MPEMLVCYCKLARKTLAQGEQGAFWPRDFKTDIQRIVDPNEITERYGRRWRFSQPKIEDGYLFGKLGFIASGTKTYPFYDEQKHDFIQQAVETPETNFVLWAINLSNQILAFEVKSPDIKYQSFRGAFEKYLRRFPAIGLEIEDFIEMSQFKSWVNDVERITLFKATLRVPNPNWAKHPQRIQEVLRIPNADKAKIEWSKLKGSKDSLDTVDTLIGDTVSYGEEGYSDIFARGEKGQRVSTFNSRRSSPSDVVTTDKSANDDVKWKLITDAVGKFIARRFKK